jgi:hypothetical protein
MNWSWRMGPDPGKANTDQLRDDINKGRTGDKVCFPDPAAAPLGTDDEAAGYPASPEQVAAVRHHERTKADRMRAKQASVQARTWLALAAAVAVIALLLWVAVR